MKFLLLLLTLITIATPVRAQEQPLNYNTFTQIPVLDNGRVKPLGAYARLYLKTLAEKENLTEKTATEWLAQALFDPARALENPIFYIRSTALKTRLNLSADQKYFSLNDLQPGIQKTTREIFELAQADEKTLTPDQKNLFDLHKNVIATTKLLRSFSMLLPLNIEISERYKNDIDAPLNYMALRTLEQHIEKDLQSIIKRKGQDPENYNDEEKSIALLGFQLNQLRQGGIANTEFRIIPIDDNNWASAWEIMESGLGSPENIKTLNQWQVLADAYREGNTESWNTTAKQIYKSNLAKQNISPLRLKIELVYQTIKPYHVAMALYVLSILLFLTTAIIIKDRDLKAHKITAYAAMITGEGALLFHLGGITSRIYILARPPVGTLYESLLFVSAILAALGISLFLKTRNTGLVITGLIAAFSLLSIAPTMLQDKDSLELLVAVLNTNFWLGTHVVCITIGYAVCILAAGIAHTYMILRLKDPTSRLLSKLFKTAYKVSLFGLLFTAIGTVLGGIWADQSWGRFWGWDPKENGALLIVLWLIWIHHGRISAKLRDLPFMATMAALNIIVAIAWFGVNLLNVGLHSYGFTSGLFTGLVTFCTLETTIILGLWVTIRLKEKQRKT